MAMENQATFLLFVQANNYSTQAPESLNLFHYEMTWAPLMTPHNKSLLMSYLCIHKMTPAASHVEPFQSKSEHRQHKTPVSRTTPSL